MPETPNETVKHERADDIAAALRNQYAPHLPPGPTADSYRIAGYTDGLVGATPECDVLRPHFDSGIKWPDPNNPLPTDVCWDRGVRGGITWDGTFYRDLTRYGQSGSLFWSAYLKPGSAPGIKNGYWFNFGAGWSHLANDDFSQILTGASQRLYWEPVTGDWRLVIEATMFVTYAVVNVWTGIKAGGNDPTGIYTRVTGCDTTATFSVEA
jgi:hypothetical protein